MQKVIALLCILLLAGCAGKQVQPIEQINTIVHPSWPLPVQPYSFNWKVIPDGEDVYIGLAYDESLEFRLFLEDMNRYIKESNSILCFYREEIAEMRCLQLDVVR